MTARTTEHVEARDRRWDRWVPPILPEFPELDAWDGPWRDDVAARPVDVERTAVMHGQDVPIEARGGTKPWEGSSRGLPINKAAAKTTKVWNLSRPITWRGWTPSFPITKVPLPSPARREGDPAGGSDRHLVVVSESRCWEAIQADSTPFVSRLRSLGQCDWTVGYDGGSSGMVEWDTTVRWDPVTAPKGGVIAASVPITPLVARFDEVEAGAIRHTLGLVMPNYSPDAPVGWARRTDGTDPHSPLRAGDIVRLTSERWRALRERHATPAAQVLLDALLLFGAMVHDKRSTGSATSRSASLRMSMDRRWGDLELDLWLSDFEIIQP